MQRMTSDYVAHFKIYKTKLRGFFMYKKIWVPNINDVLFGCPGEKGGIAMRDSKENVVGHVMSEISQITADINQYVKYGYVNAIVTDNIAKNIKNNKGDTIQCTLEFGSCVSPEFTEEHIRNTMTYIHDSITQKCKFKSMWIEICDGGKKLVPGLNSNPPVTKQRKRRATKGAEGSDPKKAKQDQGASNTAPSKTSNRITKRKRSEDSATSESESEVRQPEAPNITLEKTPPDSRISPQSAPTSLFHNINTSSAEESKTTNSKEKFKEMKEKKRQKEEEKQRKHAEKEEKKRQKEEEKQRKHAEKERNNEVKRKKEEEKRLRKENKQKQEDKKRKQTQKEAEFMHSYFAGTTPPSSTTSKAKCNQTVTKSVDKCQTEPTKDTKSAGSGPGKANQNEGASNTASPSKTNKRSGDSATSDSGSDTTQPEGPIMSLEKTPPPKTAPTAESNSTNSKGADVGNNGNTVLYTNTDKQSQTTFDEKQTHEVAHNSPQRFLRSTAEKNALINYLKEDQIPRIELGDKLICYLSQHIGENWENFAMAQLKIDRIKLFQIESKSTFHSGVQRRIADAILAYRNENPKEAWLHVFLKKMIDFENLEVRWISIKDIVDEAIKKYKDKVDHVTAEGRH